jgi:DNA-binding CsgD family transcriptional regulator
MYFVPESLGNMPIGIEGVVIMARLTSRNFQKLQACIRELYSNLDSATVPSHVVGVLSRIIPAGVTSYATISRRERKLVYTGLASCRRWEQLDAFVRHMDEHPVLSYLHPVLLRPHRFRDEIERALRRRLPSLRQAQHYAAARISDALPHHRYRSLGIYEDFFRRNDADYQLLISFLPTGTGYSLLSFNRDRRDFTEEERLILNLLAPHIAQASRNAAACEKARLAFDVLERSKPSLESYGLTGREAAVLYWVAQGKTNAEAAAVLRLAPGTVKVHLEKVYRKLGVENRTAAAALALGQEAMSTLRVSGDPEG